MNDPIPTHFHPKNRAFAALFALLAIAVLGIGTFGLISDISLPSNENAGTNARLRISNLAKGNVSDTKTYHNSKYAYSIIVPSSWGRISEFDGSFENPPMVSATSMGTNYIIIGSRDDNTAEQGTKVTIISREKRTLIEATNTAEEDVESASDFTTSSGVSGKRVTYDRQKHSWMYGYVFEKKGTSIEIGTMNESDVVLKTVKLASTPFLGHQF